MNNERLGDVIQAVGPDFHGLSYRERLIVGAVLKHLSTPPADDVREALTAVLNDSLLCWTYNGTHTVFHPTKGADA